MINADIVPINMWYGLPQIDIPKLLNSFKHNLMDFLMDFKTIYLLYRILEYIYY